MNLIKIEIERRYSESDESRRLFHGRGHCFPGYEDLVIDWFYPVVLVTLYRQREDPWLKRLVQLLQLQIPGMETVVLQERYMRGSPSRVLFGILPAEVNAVETGLRYCLRLNEAQNIGFFPDMAQGRALVKDQAAGRKVLNLFAYSCSFSIAAIAGGAAQVVNLDMNRRALELGRLNHQLNGFDLRKVSFLQLELFRSFGRLRKLAPFDLVICDPPADQRKNFQAKRDWPKLIRKIPALLKSGGEILACLSSPHLPPDYIQQLFTELRPQARLLQIMQAGENFPEADQDKGLNLLHYQID